MAAASCPGTSTRFCHLSALELVQNITEPFHTILQCLLGPFTKKYPPEEPQYVLLKHICQEHNSGGLELTLPRLCLCRRRTDLSGICTGDS